ncbi:uncharacterized protein LOC121727101 [Aricia agestis]|uniref:uncharacterized protein LOC121727101 n=1 Tax=Aricia agestis TaxID=91739 RepID=UPI001C20841C|nr:uncharacterized protein LOC121727101 [Aricia agestis]
MYPVTCELPHLPKAAAKIALHNFQWHFATLVVFNSSLVCTATEFIKFYGKSLLMDKTLIRVPENITQLVLFALDVDDLHNMLKTIKERGIDNTGKYIVVCQKDDKPCDEKAAVDILWQYRVANVLVLNIKADRIEGYTYFFDKNCKNGPSVNVLSWGLEEQQQNQRTALFPIKFKDMHGCPLYVSTFIQPPYMQINDTITGADGDLLLILMNALNAELRIMTPLVGVGWGYKDENGTWVGSLGDVYYDWANFSMTSASLTLARFSSFDISTGYNKVSIVWVTHPSKIEPASMKLLRPLQANARIALSVSFLLTIAFVILLKTNFAEAHLGRVPEGMFFHCWEMCMGQPLTRLPVKMTFLYIVLFGIWYCYLIRTFYQVYLIDSLKNDVYIADITSIDEYIRAEYPYGGGLALRDFYLDCPAVYDSWINIESDEIFTVLRELGEGKKFVLAMNSATADAYQRNYKKNLYVLPETIASSHAVLFFKKYSPLVKSINIILKRLVESGLVEKIYEDNALSQYKRIPTSDQRPIKLQHFTGCYLILVVGWTLSGIVFCVELYMGRKNKVK